MSSQPPRRRPVRQASDEAEQPTPRRRTVDGRRAPDGQTSNGSGVRRTAASQHRTQPSRPTTARVGPRSGPALTPPPLSASSSSAPKPTPPPDPRPRPAGAGPEWPASIEPTAALASQLRKAALIIFALGVGAFLIVGANRPANPHLVPPNGRVSTAGLTSFGATSFSVIPVGATSASGDAPPHTGCALLARTSAQQAQGLTGQTSLHGFAGLAFTFSPPRDALFSMKDTPVALSIAWFDASGHYIASRDLAPCPASRQFCPSYSAGRPVGVALEVARGKLGSFGIGPGSLIQLTGPCTG